MTREQFDELVRRIERRFGPRPLALRLTIAALVVLGYAVLLIWFLHVPLVGVILLSLAPVAGDHVICLLLFAAGCVLLVLGGFHAVGLLGERLEGQAGRPLRRKEAPPLFKLSVRLRAALQSKRFHEVRITTKFNASVEFIPRLGVFGWPRRVLCVGLPLMETLSSQECEAVLAHEFAHLSRQHGRFGAWIYRLRQMWQRTFEEFREPVKSRSRRLARKLLVKFIDWYWPRFNAHALLLSRLNEYAADRSAADWAGRESMVLALWSIEFHSQRLQDEFWPALWISIASTPEPPSDLTVRLAAVFALPAAPADARRWMNQAAHRLTDHVDTHPSLSDRLRALGQAADAYPNGDCPGAACPSAAATLLGDALLTIRRDVDSLWQQELRQAWRSRRHRLVSLQHRLTTLERASGDADASPDVLWDKAQGTLDLEGPAAAEPILRRLLTLNPEHSAANVSLGQVLLGQGRAEGEQYLRRVLAKEDDALVPAACHALSQYFLSVGKMDAVQEIHQQLSRFEAAMAAANRERNVVTAADRFLPHDLSADELAALQDVLSREPDLASAHLVRKELKHFSRQPLFVLCLRSNAHRLSLHQGHRDRFVVAQLLSRVRLPGRALLIAPRGSFRALGRAVMATAGAQVYPVR